ncbi:MAG: DUF4352 domain-containing protein [Syntrophomonadaceae bacterium]|nr:DUF4352 domain-containing protein [Syntrophomonadaceae bacterium]
MELYSGLALIAIAIMYWINADKKKKALSVTDPDTAKKNYDKAMVSSIIVMMIGLICIGVWFYKTGSSIAQSTQSINVSGVSSNVTIEVPEMMTTDIIDGEEAQGIFKILHLKITNEQKDAIYVNCANYALIDDQDREFTYSDINLTNDKAISFKKLNPGLTLDGYIAYDVPKDATGLKLKCRGGMTGEAIYLDLD